MKYEMIFGDEKLFDGAHEDAVIAIKRPFIEGVRSEKSYFFSTTFDAVMRAGSLFNFNDVILKTDEYAERRIIKVPVWKKADQLAGKLPEVGAEVMCMDDSRHNFVGESIHAEHWALCHGKTKKVFHIPATAVRPVETDTERQQRLKEEWCSNALDSASILSGMREYELKRLGGYIGNIYDALLSGELAAPKGGE